MYPIGCGQWTVICVGSSVLLITAGTAGFVARIYAQPTGPIGGQLMRYSTVALGLGLRIAAGFVAVRRLTE
jgi:hypothetical protein